MEVYILKKARFSIPFLLVCASIVLVALAVRTSKAENFADPAFQQTWERTDKPVVDGVVKRSFYWGPAAGPQEIEPYTEGIGGKRLVQYFDKSRMEINNPPGKNANSADPFRVTNGLLTVELVTGKMQIGPSTFVNRYPAQIPLASDTDDPNAPTYASFAGLMAPVGNKVGSSSVSYIDRAGKVTPEPNVAATTAESIVYFEPSTGHNIPKVFWDFLNASGPVYSGGKLTTAKLSDPWFYASGFPISEPYWAKVKINGQSNTDVYIQAYQRRVLTYVPSLPPEFQVQMGNIGQHYYDWRYKNAGQGTGGQTALPQPTGGASAGDSLLITGAVKTPATLNLTALKPIAAQTVQVSFGAGDNHTYKGPLLLDLLQAVGGDGNKGRDLPIRYIVATGQNGQKAVLSWGEIDPIFEGTKAIVAYNQDGSDLQGGQGPVRLIMPSDKTGGRSLYALSRLEVRALAPNKPSGSVLQITGAVKNPLSLTANDVASRNPVTEKVTYESGGVSSTHSYTGVPLLQLLNEAGANVSGQSSATRYIVAANSEGRQAVISWGELDPAYSGLNIIVAFQENGIALGGGLTRLVMPNDARGGRDLPYLLSLDVRDAGQ